MKKWTLLLGLAAFCCCEKDISLNLKESEPVLAVEAQIENNESPRVVLTRSFSYFEKIDPALLTGLFVRNAEVYMSDGSLTHRLKEYRLQVVGGILTYYYSTDSASLATAFRGQLGKSYTLRIIADGKEYNAVTSIPASANFPDSLWFRHVPFQDTIKRVLYMKATDPPGRVDYVRYFTKRNRGAFLPGERVSDDQLIDGTTYEVLLAQGIDRNKTITSYDTYYTRGDTLTLKYCAINKATYNFWNTWEFAYQSIGNPFAQPNKVTGNISNGALGVFSGYAARYQTLLVR
jgi:hypothetical protein